MAKRKKSGRRVTRRRRVGGVGGVNTERLLGLVGGAVAAGFANNLLASKIDGKLAAAGTVAVGLFLPKFLGKSQLLAGVGDGMIAAGGLSLMRELGVIQGMPLISGYQNLTAINGLPSEIANFKEEPSNNYKPFSMGNVINGLDRQFDESKIA